MKYLLAILLCINTAFAATFPGGPVTIIIPLPAGSGPDVMTRHLAEQLTTKWSQTVVIENRPGASGIIAMDAFVNEVNNPSLTLYLATSENIISFPLLYRAAPFHSITMPVAPFFKNDLMLFTSPTNATYKDLQAQIARRPIFGTQSLGSSSHLAGLELAQHITQTPSTVIPYKEYNQWFVEVANQTVTYGFGTVASTKGLEEKGKLKYIATTGSRRNPDYPTVPTIKEAAGIDVTNVGWLAFYASKNLSDADKITLIRDLNDAIHSTTMTNTITSVSYQPYTGTLKDFEQQIPVDTKRFQNLINKYGIKLN